MNTTWRTALIITLLLEAISVLLSLKAHDIKGTVGVWSFLLSLIVLLIGVLLTFSKRMRMTGKGILIGSGITLLIALSLCSIR